MAVADERSLTRHREGQRELATWAIEKFIKHGRIGFDVDAVLAGVERQDAEEATACFDPGQIPVPVVRLDLVDGVAVTTRAGQLALAGMS